MNPPEKRRGGSGSAHVLRAGSHTHHPSRSKEKDTATIPTPPPRAAVPEDPSDPSPRKDKPRELKEKDQDKSPARTKRRDSVREKDERIAHLEREMATMEREFHTQLDILSEKESETATFWHARHSTLNQTFLRADTELRLLRTEAEEMRRERDAVRAQARERDEELRQLRLARDEEIRSLKGQVRGLKEFVSVSTRNDGQTSDEVFGDGMARLGNGLQNWVIVHFRKAKMGKFFAGLYPGYGADRK